MENLRATIATEIRQTCINLGTGSEQADIISGAAIGYVYRALTRLGAGSELLSVIERYGDTLTDAEVLTCLREYNAGRPVIVDVNCSVEANELSAAP